MSNLDKFQAAFSSVRRTKSPMTSLPMASSDPTMQTAASSKASVDRKQQFQYMFQLIASQFPDLDVYSQVASLTSSLTGQRSADTPPNSGIPCGASRQKDSNSAPPNRDSEEVSSQEQQSTVYDTQSTYRHQDTPDPNPIAIPGLDSAKNGAGYHSMDPTKKSNYLTSIHKRAQLSNLKREMPYGQYGTTDSVRDFMPKDRTDATLYAEDNQEEDYSRGRLGRDRHHSTGTGSQGQDYSEVTGGQIQKNDRDTLTHDISYSRDTQSHDLSYATETQSRNWEYSRDTRSHDRDGDREERSRDREYSRDRQSRGHTKDTRSHDRDGARGDRSRDREYSREKQRQDRGYTKDTRSHDRDGAREERSRDREYSRDRQSQDRGYTKDTRSHDRDSAREEGSRDREYSRDRQSQDQGYIEDTRSHDRNSVRKRRSRDRDDAGEKRSRDRDSAREKRSRDREYSRDRESQDRGYTKDRKSRGQDYVKDTQGEDRAYSRVLYREQDFARDHGDSVSRDTEYAKYTSTTRREQDYQIDTQSRDRASDDHDWYRQSQGNAQPRSDPRYSGIRPSRFDYKHGQHRPWSPLTQYDTASHRHFVSEKQTGAGHDIQTLDRAPNKYPPNSSTTTAEAQAQAFLDSIGIKPPVQHSSKGSRAMPESFINPTSGTLSDALVGIPLESPVRGQSVVPVQMVQAPQPSSMGIHMQAPMPNHMVQVFPVQAPVIGSPSISMAPPLSSHLLNPVPTALIGGPKGVQDPPSWPSSTFGPGIYPEQPPTGGLKPDVDLSQISFMMSDPGIQAFVMSMRQQQTSPEHSCRDPSGPPPSNWAVPWTEDQTQNLLDSLIAQPTLPYVSAESHAGNAATDPNVIQTWYRVNEDKRNWSLSSHRWTAREVVGDAYQGIQIEGLPTRSTGPMLRDGLFHKYKKFGDVASISIIDNKQVPRYVVLCFKNTEDAKKALIATNDTVMFKSKLCITPHNGFAEDETPTNVSHATETSKQDEYHPRATRTLFVGNVGPNITSAKLHEMFSQFGHVIKIVLKNTVKNAHNYAFIEFDNIESVVRAIGDMDGAMVGLRTIKLGFAKSMDRTSWVWLGNLDPETDKDTLCQAFSHIAPVLYHVIDSDRCEALLNFENKNIGERIVTEMRGHTVLKNKIQVDFASKLCQQLIIDRTKSDVPTSVTVSGAKCGYESISDDDGPSSAKPTDSMEHKDLHQDTPAVILLDGESWVKPTATVRQANKDQANKDQANKDQADPGDSGVDRSASPGTADPPCSDGPPRTDLSDVEPTDRGQASEPHQTTMGDDEQYSAIKICNLPVRSSDSSIRDGLFHECKRFGKVITISVVNNKTESRHAIVCFKKSEDAKNAREKMNGSNFFRSMIIVTAQKNLDTEGDCFWTTRAVSEFHVLATRILYIGNLAKDVSSEDLLQIFKKHGAIVKVQMKTTFAFAEYEDIKSVVAAISEMDGEVIHDNKCNLGFAKTFKKTCEVWVDHVGQDVSYASLCDTFSAFGPPTYALMDRRLSRAIIGYPDADMAGQAVEALRGSQLGQSRIATDFATDECKDIFSSEVVERLAMPSEMRSQVDQEGSGYENVSDDELSHKTTENVPKQHSEDSNMSTSNGPHFSRSHESCHLGSSGITQIGNTIKVYKLPAGQTDSAVCDGLLDIYKKYGEVVSGAIVDNKQESRHVVIYFKRNGNAKKALTMTSKEAWLGPEINIRINKDLVMAQMPSHIADRLDISRSLFIGNLEKEILEKDLHQVFSKYGNILGIDIKAAGMFAAYAFIEFDNISSVVCAFHQLDGSLIGKNKIKLGFGKSKPESCVWLENLGEDVSGEFLHHAFSYFGPVIEHIIDREAAQALVYYEEKYFAEKAVGELRGTMLGLNKIKIDFASMKCQTVFKERSNLDCADSVYADGNMSDYDHVPSGVDRSRARYPSIHSHSDESVTGRSSTHNVSNDKYKEWTISLYQPLSEGYKQPTSTRDGHRHPSRSSRSASPQHSSYYRAHHGSPDHSRRRRSLSNSASPHHQSSKRARKDSPLPRASRSLSPAYRKRHSSSYRAHSRSPSYTAVPRRTYKSRDSRSKSRQVSERISPSYQGNSPPYKERRSRSCEYDDRNSAHSANRKQSPSYSARRSAIRASPSSSRNVDQCSVKPTSQSPLRTSRYSPPPRTRHSPRSSRRSYSRSPSHESRRLQQTRHGQSSSYKAVSRQSPLRRTRRSSRDQTYDTLRSTSRNHSPVDRTYDRHCSPYRSRSPMDRKYDRHCSPYRSRSPMDRKYDRHCSPYRSRSPMDRKYDRHCSPYCSRSSVDRKYDRHRSMTRSPVDRRYGRNHSAYRSRSHSPVDSRYNRHRSPYHSRSPIDRRYNRHHSPHRSRSPVDRKYDRHRSMTRSPVDRRYGRNRSPYQSRSPMDRRYDRHHSPYRSPKYRDRSRSPMYRSYH